MKRNRLFILGVGAFCATAALGVSAYAQTLAGTGAAIGAGATLGAAGGAGLLTPGQYAKPATDAMNRAGQGMEGGPPGAAGMPGAAGAGGAGGATVFVPTAKPPLTYGPDSGDAMVRQLMSAPRASKRATARSSNRARRVSRMTKTQRTRMVNAKYKKPAVGYLSWYLPEDRYKMTSKVWQFVTTPNDRFYYRPWAASMRTRSAARVIGFHTWQDAMIAGYRPDPVSKPEPGPQLSYLASLTRGPMLSMYFEYVYAGQITPGTFDANYRYVQYVAKTVNSQSHTRPFMGDTIEQVLGAAMGQNELPKYVGNPPVVEVSTTMGGPSPMAMGGAPGMPGAPMAPPAGGMDKREEEYNRFGNNAAGLARKP